MKLLVELKVRNKKYGVDRICKYPMLFFTDTDPFNGNTILNVYDYMKDSTLVDCTTVTDKGDVLDYVDQYLNDNFEYAYKGGQTEYLWVEP